MQAVERVRITVQLRRLANSSKQEAAALPSSELSSQFMSPTDKLSNKKPSRASSSMSLESMRSVMSSLRSKHKPSAASVSDLRDAR